MSIEKWSETIWVVALSDEPALSEDLLTAQEAVAQARPAPDVVVDLSAVSYVNSSNLSQLLRLRKIMIDRDRRLKLAGIADSVWAVFLTTGLDKVFDFANDLTTALTGLQIGD